MTSNPHPVIPPPPHLNPYQPPFLRLLSTPQPTIPIASLPCACRYLQTCLPSNVSFSLILSLLSTYGLCAAYQCQPYYEKLQFFHKEVFSKQISDIWSKLRSITGGFVPQELDFMRSAKESKFRYTQAPEETPNRGFQRELERVRDMLGRVTIEEVGEVKVALKKIRGFLEKQYELNCLQRLALEYLENKFNIKWMPPWRIFCFENRLQSDIPKSLLPLCCRTSFLLGEQLPEQSQKIQYFEDEFDQSIVNSVCAFLNSKGGMILIGVKKDMSNRVKPLYIPSKKAFDSKLTLKLSSIRKQSLLTNLLKIEYIPVKDECFADEQHFVVRMTVKCDSSLNVFLVKSKNRQRFFVMKHSQTTALNQCDFYDYQVQRLEENLNSPPIQRQYLFHEGPCKKQPVIQVTQIKSNTNLNNVSYTKTPSQPLISNNIFNSPQKVDNDALFLKNLATLNYQSVLSSFKNERKSFKSFEKAYQPSLSQRQKSLENSFLFPKSRFN